MRSPLAGSKCYNSISTEGTNELLPNSSFLLMCDLLFVKSENRLQQIFLIKHLRAQYLIRCPTLQHTPFCGCEFTCCKPLAHTHTHTRTSTQTHFTITLNYHYRLLLIFTHRDKRSDRVCVCLGYFVALEMPDVCCAQTIGAGTD